MTNTLVDMIYGSHLYGTNTPMSDTDYKSVYLPTLREVIVGDYPKSINTMTKKGGTSSDEKNTPDDVDRETYALQRFLQMGFMGETVFLDMVHNRHTILKTTPIWESLYENRAKFYTSDMKAYLGYCKSQAAKYGIKGTRLEEGQKLLDLFKAHDPKNKVLTIWDLIEETEHVQKIEKAEHINGDNRFIDMCGKQIQGTATIGNYIPMLENFVDSYGRRARTAMTNDGVDWKAISHAFRAGYQLIEIYETGDLKFPLAQADYLRDMKQGKLHFGEDMIAEKLDMIVERCYTLAKLSGLPAKVDREFFNTWLIDLYV